MPQSPDRQFKLRLKVLKREKRYFLYTIFLSGEGIYNFIVVVTAHREGTAIRRTLLFFIALAKNRSGDLSCGRQPLSYATPRQGIFQWEKSWIESDINRYVRLSPIHADILPKSPEVQICDIRFCVDTEKKIQKTSKRLYSLVFIFRCLNRNTIN